jgi:hypothetical protein
MTTIFMVYPPLSTTVPANGGRAVWGTQGQ